MPSCNGSHAVPILSLQSQHLLRPTHRIADPPKPPPTQIHDRKSTCPPHAKEKIWDLSKVIYGSATDTSKRWAENTVQILKAGEIETLIEILQLFSSKHSEVATTIGYFDRNRERMRYQKFRDQGLCVSSAVVEAGCKNVIGARLKRGRMHWSKHGANKIAVLRASVISNRFDDYCYAKANNS